MGTTVNPNSSQPMVNPTVQQPADWAGLGRSIDGMAGLYRYNADRSRVLGDAVDMLRNQPQGQAVVVTESASRYGNNAFGGVHYNGMSVSEPMSVQDAIDRASAATITRPGDIQKSYVVYKDAVCPANTHGASMMTFEQANNLR
jgi:hypothetical protein